MNLEFFKSRKNILIMVYALVISLFVGRLIQMQLVQGDYYESQIYKGTVKKQEIPAARGEILDRYGNPLVVNRVSYDIVLDKTYLASQDQYKTILALTELLRSTDEAWLDNLPITEETPYAYLPERDRDVTRLRKYADVNSYATAEEVMYWLISKYKLQEYTQQEQRILAGILYEMDVKGFNYSTPYTFARDVSIETTTRIKEINFQMPGVDVVQSVVRDYPDGTIAAHILGLTGPIYPEEIEALGDDYKLDDIVGKSGIEYAYEKQLRGTSGEKLIYINDQGEVTDVVVSKEPKAGDSVMLSIDKRMQIAAQQALENQIKRLQETAPPGKGKEAFSGAVVAVDVETGEVLALASYPTYDLATYNQNYSELVNDKENRPLINRALQGSYTPGSIYKPVVALAGLAEGIIDRDSTVYCGRVYTYFGPGQYQPTCLGHHGDVDAATALKYSCNIFFYDVGRRLGIENINKYATLLGLAQDQGLELPSAKGQLSSPELSKSMGQTWMPGDVVQAAIGQKDNKFTPLQLAGYTASLANRGKRVKLTLVNQIKDYTMENSLYEHTPTVIAESPLDPEVFDEVVEGMVMASRTGTAVATFGQYPIDVASKTGTPETSDLPNSTFIAFAPAQNPKIAVSVVIEKGWHGYTGAPVARAVFDAYFSSEVTNEEPVQGGVLLP